MGQAVERSKEECMGSWHAGALCVAENGPQPPYANDTLQPVAASQPQWRAGIARKSNPPTIPVSCSLASMALSSNIDPVNTPANRQMHNQSLLIMCSSRWVLGALSRCRCCANNIHVLGASTLPSPWTWIMPRKSAAPRDARESCYWLAWRADCIAHLSTDHHRRTAHCLSVPSRPPGTTWRLDELTCMHFLVVGRFATVPTTSTSMAPRL